MNKALLTWLVASSSLMAVLLIASVAQAVPITPQITELVPYPSHVATANLNLSISPLFVTSQRSNPILHSLGCSCAACNRQISL